MIVRDIRVIGIIKEEEKNIKKIRGFSYEFFGILNLLVR